MCASCVSCHSLRCRSLHAKTDSQMPHLPSTSQWACPMATQCGTRPKSLESHGFKQTLFDTLSNKLRCAIATTCNKTPWSKLIFNSLSPANPQNAKHTPSMSRKQEHMHHFFVRVCACALLLVSFRCFYIFPAYYWQILSRQSKKRSFMDKRRALPPRRRKQDVAAYPLCHWSPDSFRCIFHRQRTISQLQILA